MKKHNTVKVVLITLLLLLLLTWIIPSGYYSGEYIDQGRVQMGLSELFNYPLTALSYFGHISLFVILIGCFYGVLYKIPAYRTYLDWIVAKFEGKESIFISLVVILLALGVSVAGLNVAYALFIPLFVSIILLMGYDKIVAALTVVGGIGAGLIGSTYAYSNLSLLYQIFGLDNDYQLAVRFIILAAAVILVLFNIVVYMKKHKNGVVVLDSSNKNEKISTMVASDDIKESKKEKNNSKKDIDKNDDFDEKDEDEENDEDDDDEKEVEEKEEEKEEEKNEKKNTSSKKSKNNKNNSKSDSSNSNSSKKNNTSKKSSDKSVKGKKSSKNPNKAALKQDDIIVVKESVMNSDEDSYLLPARVEVTNKVWPFVIGFSLMFILVVLAFITWGDNGFNITLFDKVTESVTNFELFGFPIFSKIYGAVNSFGNWSIVDLFLPMALLILLLSLIYDVKFNDVLDGMASGAKKALAPAFIILLLYTILVLTTYHPFQLAIYKAVLGLSKGYNIATTTIVGLLASIFNIEPAYVFQSSIPYYTAVVTNTAKYANAGIIFQTMYGFSSLFAPTSVILMCVLSYLKISYKEWFKAAWKLLLEILAILLIVFIILSI